MSELDNSALVPCPPVALEKVEPGPKRILSGMVADTLALVRGSKPRRPSPTRIVMANDEPAMLELTEDVIRCWFPQINLLSFENGAIALEELSKADPDLLITDDNMPRMHG